MGTGPQLTAGEVSRRSHKYEQIVVQGLQRAKSFTGDVGLHLALPPPPPSLSQTQLASPTVWFQEAMQGQVPALQKQDGREALLSRKRAAPPGVLCPPKGAEPPPHPTSRQHPSGSCRESSFALNIVSSMKEADSRLI